MKYKVQTIINKPIDLVSSEMRSRESAFKWIKGLEKFDLIEGEMEAVGSKYQMVFNSGQKVSTMTETITAFNPPSLITTVYETKGVWNECINTFESIGNQTKYVMDVTFKFSFPVNLFIWMFKKTFKKESLNGLVAFKDYVEQL
ncbi:MAG: hypothetical protein K8Q99_01250 [Acholeplasmataceae bacterium]|nr:hypothetical protein [Acholeplasmataceae bacterium]